MFVEDYLAREHQAAASRRIRPRHRWPAARSDLRCSAHWAQEAVDREVADPVALLDPFVHRLAEVESHEDARDAVLLRGSGEARVAAVRVTGDGSVHVLPAGSVRLQVVKPMWSVPKNRFRTVEPAPPWTACAES